MDFADPWDFGEMYAALYDWTRGYRFDPEREQYWAHITTGTHVAQICMFLMVESRTIPGVLLQTSPPRKQAGENPGRVHADRPGPVALRRAGPPLQPGAGRRAGIPQEWHSHAQQGLQQADRRDRTSGGALAGAHPLTGPTGAGKSHLARRMYELKKSRHQVRASSSRSIAPRCAATAPPRRCSATRKAPSPARPPTGPACCAPPTRACCSWTRSANWAWTNRPCCSRPLKKNASCPWAATARPAAISS